MPSFPSGPAQPTRASRASGSRASRSTEASDASPTLPSLTRAKSKVWTPPRARQAKETENESDARALAAVAVAPATPAALAVQHGGARDPAALARVSGSSTGSKSSSLPGIDGGDVQPEPPELVQQLAALAAERRHAVHQREERRAPLQRPPDSPRDDGGLSPVSSMSRIMSSDSLLSDDSLLTDRGDIAVSLRESGPPVFAPMRPPCVDGAFGESVGRRKQRDAADVLTQGRGDQCVCVRVCVGVVVCARVRACVMCVLSESMFMRVMRCVCPCVFV